jgi:hypothetical protein
MVQSARAFHEISAALAPLRRTQQEEMMGSRAAVGLYAIAMVVIIVGVDILVFRDRFWERLISNVGIVLVFAAFYLRFLKRS